MTKSEKWFAWDPVKVNGKWKWFTEVRRYKKQKLGSRTDYTSVYTVGD